MSITPKLEINTRLITGPCQLVSLVKPEKLKIHLCVPFSNNYVDREKKNKTNADFLFTYSCSYILFMF